MKKRSVLLGAAVTLALVLGVSAAALAANIDCAANTECIGTRNPDTLNGSPGDDEMSGRAGGDLLKGNGGRDQTEGGLGADKVLGGVSIKVALNVKAGYFTESAKQKIQEAKGKVIAAVESGEETKEESPEQK